MAQPALTNAQLAGLLAEEAENESGILVRAYRRAARSAFLWPETVAAIVDHGGSLLELHGGGPFIARKLTGWLKKPPIIRPRVPPDRRDFLTMADALTLIAK